MRKTLIPLLFWLCALPAQAEIRRLDFDGAWYGENRVDGKLAVLFSGQRIVTHDSVLPLPGGVNVLYTRVSPDGCPFKIAGQDHSGRGNVEYDGSTWHIAGDSYGVSPVIYDRNCQLHQAKPQHGSQGFRFVGESNRIFTGDETYADPSRAIWEWTQHGDITIGQGERGCIAIRGPSRFLLHPGECRFVRYSRISDRLAVTMVTPAKTIMLWLDAADLAKFPPDETTPPQPPDPPKPEPPIPAPVDCGEVPALGQKLLRKLAEVYSDEIRSPDDEQRRVWAMRAAQQLAFSVSPEWGTKRADPGRPLSKDAVSRVINGRLCNWDIVNGATRELTFGHGEDITGQVFVPVQPKDHLGGTSTPIPPDPEPPSCEACEANLAVALARIESLTFQKEAAEARVGALEVDLRTLDAKHAEALLELDKVKQERDKALAVSCVVEGGWAPFRGRCRLVR